MSDAETFVRFTLFVVWLELTKILLKHYTEKFMAENTEKTGDELGEATQNFLDKWTDRYGHTKVGKVLKFLGFGSK